MIARGHLVIAIAIACGAAAAMAAPQVRENAPRTNVTTTISGRVVEAVSTQPARRVRVTLTDVARRNPGQTTTTADDGTFAFRGVTAGRYELQAFKNGYLRASYGASRPDRAGTPVVVTDNSIVTGLTIAIARGGVITGVVRDSQGQPLPGRTVLVLKLGYHPVTGEPNLGAPAGSVVSPTDDRGEYRAFGLPPGGYLVVVNPPLGRAGGAGLEDIHVLSTDDVRRALQEARGGPPAIAPSTAAPPSSSRVTNAPVFHPGVTDIGAAARVSLGVSEERIAVDVVVSLVPTATISGRITSPTGTLPPMLQVVLLPAGQGADMLAGVGIRRLAAAPAGDGSYAIAGVAPGSYRLKAATGMGRGAAPNTSTPSAVVDINVSGQDIEMPLTLQPGVAINGRVVFDGATPTAAELQTLQFQLLPQGSGGVVLPGGGGRVDAQGSFTFAGVPPDAYRFQTIWNSAGASDKWTIKSAVANGSDALESPILVTPNKPVEWTITYTDTPTTLAGTFQDRSGRAATDYDILVFSSDRKYWTPGSRRTRTTRPATDGVYSIKGLPAGEYQIAALTDLEPGEWNDPTLLERLLPFSIKVTLREGERTTQDVRIGG